MAQRIHGYGGKEKLYRVWSSMRDRCNNPRCKDYKYYGKMGVRVCQEWDDYMAFRNWSYANGYVEGAGLSIDRIDVGGNYEPQNCRWSTRKEQANNMTSNHLLTVDGETCNISEWAELVGIPARIIEARVQAYGWSPEEAVKTPVNAHRRMYEMNGESHSIPEWASIVGINKNTLYNRINRYGWSFEDAISIRPKEGGHY